MHVIAPVVRAYARRVRTRGAVASGVIAVALVGHDAPAGSTRARPPVKVIAPAPPPSGLYPDDLPGPPLEVVADPAKLALPPVPAFELPASEPGVHGPRELRVRGRALSGTELQVRGYVTWIYDCAAELARSNPNATSAEIAESIEREPQLCDPPMFSLGETRQTPRDSSIWVVDVPRALTRAERTRTPRAAPSSAAAAPLVVGAPVVVTGTWATESPRGERNAGGLLVYRTHAPQPPGVAVTAMVATTGGLPEIEVVTEIPLRTIIDTDVRNASVAQLNACNRALTARQHDAALTACRAATDAWPDNHLAWYAWASVHLARGEWREAQAAIAHAVALRPDQGMYQLYDGIARYEAVHQQAREDHARKTRQRPEAVSIAPPIGALDEARDALLRATRLAPSLWRARYYLGRIYRDVEDARRAAEQLTEALALHPGYRPAYLALAELYRRWGYVDQAIAVALIGTTHITADTADLWFELAMAHDARHADFAALAALGKALASRPDDTSSLLQRGQIYLRKGDATSARRDLEQVTRSTDPRTAVARRVATQLLARLASRTRVETSSSRRHKKVYRPAEDTYEPWNVEDSKFRF